MILVWMGYAALMAGIFTVTAMTVEWAFRAYRRTTRWLWIGAIVISVIVPLAALTAGNEADPFETRADWLARVESTPSVTMPAAVLRFDGPFRLSSLDRPLALAWLIASMLLALRFGASLGRMAWHRRTWQADDVGGTTVRIAPDLGPAVVGFLSPAIVLPSWIRTLDRRLLQLVVAHEREHVRAGDSSLMTVAGAIAVLLPWNLPLWWQIRRLRLAVEIDCDRRVLAQRPDVAMYANLLCEISAMRSRRRFEAIPFGQSGLTRPTAFLERRIRHMTAAVPRHRRLKALGVAIVALALLSLAAVPGTPPALTAGEATQQEYALLIAGIEYRNARSIAELQPEQIWRETYEAYEDMEIVDRRVITREEVCYTTREPDGRFQLHTRPTAPEIDSLWSASAGDESAELIARFLRDQNGGKPIEFMAYTVEERAVCFLLRGEPGGSGPAMPRGDEDGDSTRDTIDFHFTPFVEHPICEEGCSAVEIGPYFAARVGAVSCSVVIGLHIDVRGRVDDVDVLKPGEVEACAEATKEWAFSTRWAPARDASGTAMAAWIAQPMKYDP